MFNLTSSTPKTWQTVSRQADRVNVEQNVHTHATNPAHSIRELGGILRERREAMGASLAEVETATRIRQKYLAALESDDWHLLPGEIVGRGFLRNYATYLGLDSTELVEQRRAVADPSMASTLAGTSSASPLPPERKIDYRPKDVALMDEQEGIQQREIRTGPFLRVLGILGVLLVAWWIVSNFGTQLTGGLTAAVNSVQTRVAPAAAPVVAVATSAGPTIMENPAVPIATIANAVATPIATITNQQSAPATSNNELQATNGSTNSDAPAAVEPAATPVQETRALILIPTNTPLLVDAASGDEAPVENSSSEVPAPIETPVAPDTPVPAPTEVPTETPTEEPPASDPPVAIAPACPDQRSVLTTPGINQLLSGVVPITGRAVHEAFQYYKLEYAFGANAVDGFVYFDGANSPVDGGSLGTFNSASLPNGVYTLQLTVVDLSANYPPPCQVTVTIQN